MAAVLSIPAAGSARTHEQAFATAYELWRGSVYRWALRFASGRTGWAEDITHDVFVRLLEHLPRLETSRDLGGWLYRVTANLALTRLRDDRSVGSRLLRFFTEEEPVEESPELSLCLKEDATDALAALRALPPKESVVLTMKVVDGKSQREIAELLSMSEGYVSKLLARAWARLRDGGWEAADARA